MVNKTTITIDGPAGAGKSTVSRQLASKIGYVYVDTGALYRGVAYEFKKENFDYIDIAKVTDFLGKIKFDYEIKNNTFKLISNGIDISDKLRTSEISMLASTVSAISEVRSTLLGIQKNIGSRYNAIFEGRDIGTVVFPDAEYKFFLTADLETRAKRRYKEMSGVLDYKSDDFNKIKENIRIRDFNDSNRKESPLIPAIDAVIIDSCGLNIEQVVERIYENLRSP